MNHNERISTIKDRLPALAEQLVTTYLDQEQPWNRDFAQNIDNPMHHKPEWHQWGILSHTFHFLEAHRTESKHLLQEWKMQSEIEQYLSEVIEGITKAELLEIGILFHDLGKFTRRQLSKKQVSTDPKYPDFTFSLHEAASERLLYSREIYAFLTEILGLLPVHIYYIGKVGAIHYELAKIRDRTKYSDFEYTYEYIGSEEYKRESLMTLRNHPDFGIEIGIMYLGDTLAKTEFRLSPAPTSEDEASGHIWKTIPLLEQRDIDPRHIAAVITQPLSIYAARMYLTHVLDYRKK